VYAETLLIFHRSQTNLSLRSADANLLISRTTAYHRFSSRSFGIAHIIALSQYSISYSDTRIPGRRQPPSRHSMPTDLLLGQATWLRFRVLDEPLAIPWCQNLACNTVMWRSRPGLRSSLWMGVQWLSSTRLLCGSVRVDAVILQMFIVLSRSCTAESKAATKL
jgi:hypothetical protein